MAPERASTHAIAIDPDRGVVTKRFRSWQRREPEHEWAALTLLAEFVPGLSPTPIRAELQADPPVIEMSRLPGVPLSTGPLSGAHADALALALTRLWDRVPAMRMQAVGFMPSPLAFADQVRLLCAEIPGTDLLVRRAHLAGADWLASGPLERPAAAEVIFGQGDPNLSNFLWDGVQIRIVDFEDCGPSDRAFELAILVEHRSAWSDAGLDADGFLARFDLAVAELERLREFRRLAALFWLLRLCRRGERGAEVELLHRQARRLLALLA